jgi:hypothetical protein
MPSRDLQKLDAEEEKLAREVFGNEKKISLDKLLGFRIPKARCFIPRYPCRISTDPITAILPLYETVFFPIYPDYRRNKRSSVEKITKDSVFKSVHGLSTHEIVGLSEKGRIVPCFAERYVNYNEEILEPFLRLGVPKVSRPQMNVLYNSQLTNVIRDPGWKEMLDLASQRTKDLTFLAKETNLAQSCAECISACYVLGLRSYFQDKRKGDSICCAAKIVRESLIAQTMDSILYTGCKIGKEVLSSGESFPEINTIEYILEGLKVSYSGDLPLEDYLDIFDGKASKALRKIISDLMSEPLTRKYSQRLSAKVYELNRQVEELAKSRTAKVFEAVSDMAVYGGKKFIESQTRRYIRIPKIGMVKIAEWLASKGIDVGARMQGKDWSLAQLYKARCKLSKCS